MRAIHHAAVWCAEPGNHPGAAEILSALGDIDPGALVRSLSISQQQLVEIAKALTLDCRVLILDEPTAALTEKEAKVLFSIMHRLAERGIAIIYISHRMAEIFEHCDRVTVFRDGQYVVTQIVAETTPTQIVNAMVGRVVDNRYPPKLPGDSTSGPPILEVENLASPGRFARVSFALHRGEILGLGGLIGAGRSEIVKGICRIDETATGELRLEGKPLALKRYQQAIDEGIVYLSEDRKGEGLFLDMPITANVSALQLGLVSAGDETGAETAVELEELPPRLPRGLPRLRLRPRQEPGHRPRIAARPAGARGRAPSVPLSPAGSTASPG
jgi:ribose transport system ATP-binding protein